MKTREICLDENEVSQGFCYKSFGAAIVLHGILLAIPLSKALEKQPNAPLLAHLVSPLPTENHPADVPAAPLPLPKPSPEITEKTSKPLVAPRKIAVESRTTPVLPSPKNTEFALSPTISEDSASSITSIALATVPAAAPTISEDSHFQEARLDANYRHNPKPEYPNLSRRLNEEGTVKLKVRVSAEGEAVHVQLEKSSSYPRLDEAARRVVRYWRFFPATNAGQAVESTVIVPVDFRLNQG